MNKPRLVVKDTSRRDLLVAITIGCVVLGLLVYAVLNMSTEVVGNTLTGTVKAKHFTPQEEHQITIGKGGMDQRNLDGEYTLEVDVSGHIYTVWVDKTIYDGKQIGDPMVFQRPK